MPIAEALDRLLRRTGRTDLKEAVERAGTRLTFCATEERLKTTLPADGTGLAVITNTGQMLSYLKGLGLYRENHIFSVSSERMEAVESVVGIARPTAVLGFGGGRVLDVAKMVAFRARAPLVSVPTAPTHDGLLSRNSALLENGRKTSYPTAYPVQVIIPEYLWMRVGELENAGRLDVLSDITALQDVSLAIEENGFVPENAYMSMATEAVVRVLNEQNVGDLAEGLFLSGLAMHDSSRYCSGAEHELEKLMAPFFDNRYFHGQLIGAATLMSSYVYMSNADKMPTKLFFDPRTLYGELRELFSKRKMLNYALRPLQENDSTTLARVLRDASSVRPERYTLWNKIDSTKVGWKNVIEVVRSV